MVDARRAVGVLAVACALAVSGCTPDGPAGPTPSPSPVVQTPVETSQERQQRLDYAAAEKAYRTFRAELDRVLNTGGAGKPTTVMKQTAAGDYLSTFAEVAESYHGLKSSRRGHEKIVYVRPNGYSAAELNLDVCEDTRQVSYYDRRGTLIGKGQLLTARVQVRKIAGRWKLWNGTGKKVTSCG